MGTAKGWQDRFMVTVFPLMSLTASMMLKNRQVPSALLLRTRA